MPKFKAPKDVRYCKQCDFLFWDLKDAQTHIQEHIMKEHPAAVQKVLDRYKSLGDEDLILDSPNWAEGRIAEFKARNFVRKNDPR